jgi:glycosyltransferase involved in cell wall biosynthesis
MPNQPETVSAVIIAYNSAAYLHESLSSVLEQTRPVDEIIVVDDGSTDATGEIVKSYADRGVRYIYQENQGCAGARNTGINASTGSFVALLDADDIWVPEKTAWQLDLLRKHPDLLMASGDKIWWDVDQNTRHPFAYDEADRADVRRTILIRNCVGNPSMTMIRRSVLDEAGLLDPNLVYGDEWELWMRIAERGAIGYVDRPVIVYRWHSGNISQRNQAERLRFLKTHVAVPAIWRSRPAWRRPLTHLRYVSSIELQLAVLAGHERRHWQHFRHAATSLLSYPAEDFGKKCIRVTRALVGPVVYQKLKQQFRPSNHLEPGDSRP